MLREPVCPRFLSWPAVDRLAQHSLSLVWVAALPQLALNPSVGDIHSPTVVLTQIRSTETYRDTHLSPHWTLGTSSNLLLTFCLPTQPTLSLAHHP